MPTYEYRCPDGHEFEKLQKINEKPRTRCPICGKGAMRLISGGAGLVFKGSGFYITDYGKDGKGPRKSTEGAAESKAEAKPDAKSEVRPDSKSEAKADSKGEAKADSKAESRPAPRDDKPAKSKTKARE